MRLVVWWQAVRLFYGSTAPALLTISGLLVLLVQLPLLLESGHASVVKLLLAKVLTGPAVWYLAQQLRPHQYWLYFNLGLSRRVLWGSVLGLDALLFVAVALSVNALYPAR